MFGRIRLKGYRYVFVVLEKFSKFGWAIPLKNKNAQIIEDSFENILIKSKRKPNLIETDRGGILQHYFSKFLK